MNFLIIDDHELVKEGITARIKKVFPKANCLFASNSRMAISKIQGTEIDLIFCDLEFNTEEDIDGFYIIKNILAFEPRIKCIALTNYNSYRIMKKAIVSGFHSFLDKGCTFKVFSDTVTNVLKTGMYESETMKILLKKRNKFLNTIFVESLYGISSLSPRERELTLLSKVTTDRNILANKMGVKPSTIDTYFKDILKKLQLKHRQELSIFSLEFEDEILNFNEK
ncbi:MAG: response regulator transcription factor [Flavobacteriales bacterium]